VINYALFGPPPPVPTADISDETMKAHREMLLMGPRLLLAAVGVR